MFFISIPFQPKQREHASIPINPLQTQYLPESPRRILYQSLTVIIRYQHRQHLKPPQVIILRQARLSNLQKRSLQECTKRSRKLPKFPPL